MVNSQCHQTSLSEKAEKNGSCVCEKQISKQHLPASIIVIVVTPTAAPPLQLTVPPDCYRGEGIHIDRWCLDGVSGSSGTKTQGFLGAAYLSCGERLG